MAKCNLCRSDFYQTQYQDICGGCLAEITEYRETIERLRELCGAVNTTDRYLTYTGEEAGYLPSKETENFVADILKILNSGE